MGNLKKLFLFLILILAACTSPSDEQVLELPATATLEPVPSLTIRVTDTQVPSRTPLPTFTFTPTLTLIPPTETLSPTPTLTPTISGIVQSLEAVRVREGPSTEFNILAVLNPGTGVVIVGQNEAGTWYNVRLEDGREGWMSSRLVRVAPTSTPFPTFTATIDLTSRALGTIPPTALIGGDSVTATPPPQVVTETTLPDASAEEDDATPESLVNGLQIVSQAEIEGTANALRGIFPTTAAPVTSVAASAATPTGDRVITVVPNSANGTVAAITPPTAPPATITPTVDINTVDGRDVFAFCDNTRFAISAPGNLRAGDFIDIWWAWFASTEAQVQDHIDAAVYELRINGEEIPVLSRHHRPIQQSGGAYNTYWYVPYGPLVAGSYEITYVVTWSRPIFDGSHNFGPETDTPFEQETCTFTVR